VPRCTIPGERIFIDISHLSYTSLAGNKYWLMVLDDANDMIWSYFIKSKSDAPPIVLHFLREMTNKGFNVKYIRLDNSGEKQYLLTLNTEHDLHIMYKYTSP
jgi:hypothetical protein